MTSTVPPIILVTNQYTEAKAACIQIVQGIVKQCKVDKTKWRDTNFDISGDDNARDKCLHGLFPEATFRTNTYKRVPDLFQKEPKFVEDYGKPQAAIQGAVIGNCWFMSALTAVARDKEFRDSREPWLPQICVERDEEVGVYGFLFFRDGRWVPVVVDDFLFTISGGADTLPYFARSANPKETWVSLLEKAYAKLHGDYSSIDNGATSEGIQDLTGAAATSEDIRDDLWLGLRRATDAKDRLFGVARLFKQDRGESKVMRDHAYTVLRAVEYLGKKFVLLRDPYGRKNGGNLDPDWTKIGTGKEWDEFRTRWNSPNLDHDRNGAFLMEYEKLSAHWTTFYYACLFGPEWDMKTLWLRVEDADLPDGIAVFSFTVHGDKPASVVISLSQLDGRYYQSVELNCNEWLDLGFKLVRVNDGKVLKAREGINFRDQAVWQESDGVLDPGQYIVYLINPELQHVDRFGKLTKSGGRTANWNYYLHKQNNRPMLFQLNELNWSVRQDEKYKQLLAHQKDNRRVAYNDLDGSKHDASNNLAETQRGRLGIEPKFIHEYYRLWDLEGSKNAEVKQRATTEFEPIRVKLDEYRDSIKKAAAAYVGLKIYSLKAQGPVHPEPAPMFK